MNRETLTSKEHICSELSLIGYSYDNKFDEIASKIISELQQENAIAIEEFGTQFKSGGGPIDDERILQVITENVEEMDMAAYDYYLDITYRNEQMLAAAKMQIIFAFMYVELNMKQVIVIAFPKEDPRKFFQWDRMVTFFQSNSIAVKSLPHFTDIDNLRKLNNNLKHSESVSAEVKTIEEFEEVNYFTYKEITTFYKRIKENINPFLGELAHITGQQLFEFPDAKLEDLADSLSSRMDRETAAKFTAILNSKYPPETKIYSEDNPFS